MSQPKHATVVVEELPTAKLMPSQDQTDYLEQLGQTIAVGVEALNSLTNGVATTTTAVGEAVGSTAQQFVEQGTEAVGNFVTPIVEHPVVRFAAKVPGINLLFRVLGQVDVEKAQADVDKLRQEHPLETPEQLAHRIMADTALKAAGIGLLTNLIPPLALALFAIDLAAVTALQAEMVYRIAAVYGFPLTEPTRRGEVFAVFALSVGGGGVLKVGLGLLELIPVIGAAIGASGDAALLYSLGYAANQFYETKRRSAA